MSSDNRVLVVLLIGVALLFGCAYSQSATCSLVGEWTSRDVLSPNGNETNVANFWSNESYAFILDLMNCSFELSGQYQVTSESGLTMEVNLANQPVGCKPFMTTSPVCATTASFVCPLLTNQLTSPLEFQFASDCKSFFPTDDQDEIWTLQNN